ncbi:MAG TPA: 6-pyruvoyl-tetrahydropterin synthase-related protein [Patescibacteria group bacterium]
MKIKQNNKSYIFPAILIFLSLLPFVSILFTNLNPHTHDGLVHLARIAAYFTALSEGEFPVRWAGYLNYGYGMPLFNFIYQTPYLITSIFIFLGFGLVWAFKFALVISFILSGIFMYMFGKELTQDNKKAFLITIFYQFAPFRLVELLIRGDIGEVYAYTFLPLVAFGLLKISKKASCKNFVITSIASAVLILSHNAMSLVFFMLCGGLVFVFSTKFKNILISFFSLFVGLGLSSFYWAPALFEHKYTYGDLFMKNLYLSHFPPIQNFFVANWFNEAHLQTGGISVQFGIFHVLAIIVVLYLLYKRKIKDALIGRLFIYSLIVSLVTIFFMQPISKFAWAHISLLRQFQFSWRLLGIITFTTSIFSLAFFEVKFFMKKWIFISLIFLVVGTTIWYWHPSLGYDKINENYYWHFPLTTTYYGETDVIWTAGPAKAYPKNPVSFAEGYGEVKNYTRNSIKHSYDLSATVSAKVVDYTEYFPGWKVFVDKKSIPIEFQDINYRGLITFRITPGKHHIEVIWGEDKFRFFTDLLSLSVLIVLLVISVFLYVKKRI